MLQNINLLNSVQNNAGLALVVAPVAGYRTNLRVEAAKHAMHGKRPCAAGTKASATAAGGTDADSDRGGRMRRDDAQATFAAFAAQAAEAAAASVSADAFVTDAVATDAVVSSSERSSEPISTMQPVPQAKPGSRASQRGARLPAAIWAALVLSRV